MKKIAFALLVTVFIAAYSPACEAEDGHNLSDLSGYLLSIEQKPPLIKLATGSGEKNFRWIPGETGFFGYEGEKIEAVVFFHIFKSSSITLILENKTVINVFATRF